MHLLARRSWFRLAACLLVLSTLVVLPRTARAADLPPATTADGRPTATFIQTSGPEATLGTGDFYTNIKGANLASGHEFDVIVPCAWPSTLPLTFALFDPEVSEPDPTTGIQADDEIRDTNGKDTTDNAFASDTHFTLTTPAGKVISKTYTPNGGTNGRWVEFVTLLTGDSANGCGTYRLNSVTDGNDDNAWVLRVTNDPDCTVTPGTCSTLGDASSALIGNGQQNDNPDGVPGSGDEPKIGTLRTSFQQYPRPPGLQDKLSCQIFYTFVNNTQPTVTFHNFDLDFNLDPNTTVRYFPPVGSNYPAVLNGTVSNNERWNNPPNPAVDANGVPLRGGDSYAIGPNDSGWWQIEVCVQFPSATVFKNQYVVEASSGLLFFNLPAAPRMTLSKTDGVDVAEFGQALDYALTFANTSDQTPTPGSAQNVQLVDQLPAGTTYQDCAIEPPYTGTCSLSGSQVVFKLDQAVAPGATGVVRVGVKVDDPAPAELQNVADLTCSDSLGNSCPPIRATDVDKTRAKAPPTAVTLASFTASRDRDGILLNWRTSSELNTHGFYVWRSVKGPLESATRVSPLIVAGNQASGSTYSWRDAEAGATYWLEEVEIGGEHTFYGPARVVTTAATQVRLLFPMLYR